MKDVKLTRRQKKRLMAYLSKKDWPVLWSFSIFFALLVGWGNFLLITFNLIVIVLCGHMVSYLSILRLLKHRIGRSKIDAQYVTVESINVFANRVCLLEDEMDCYRTILDETNLKSKVEGMMIIEENNSNLKIEGKNILILSL